MKQVSAPVAYREMTANALSSGRASEWARTTANEWGLLEVFDERPEEALEKLRQVEASGRGGRQELFALSELSFEHAEHGGGRSWYLASAVYAYAYLFASSGSDGTPALDPLDPRTRLAADLYNRAVTAAFRVRGTDQVAVEPGSFPLPWGEFAVATDPSQFRWGDRVLVDLTPSSEVEVEGMRNRHLVPGIGAALTAAAEPLPGVDVYKSLIAPRARVATTLVLRVDDVLAGIASGRMSGRLDLYAASEFDRASIEGREVGLEVDETAPLAVMLAGSPVWKQEFWAFFGRNSAGVPLPVLASIEPYRPGRIPVVFVHGTESSPARWADMANDLLADPWIHQRYQFWYFSYDSGNPIPYSALLLREKLRKAIEQLDPEGHDPCLRDMVVIGHSQGGLLTKMTAIRTGDALWNAIFKVPPEQVPVSGATKDLLRRGLFVEPMPSVKRLVFISTPHRGSFLTGGIVNRLVRRLVKLPGNLASLAVAVATAGPNLLRGGGELDGVPTAVDNMTPGNPFLGGLATTPVAPGVPYHSIISVEEQFQEVAKGNDGVVEYTSAHLDGATSEFVVRSPHSCQANPDTVQEVRRILRVHAEEVAETGQQCGPAPRPAAR
ncbi:MAG: esterase/lipase family protein [Alphaproteobacteria bacterium]